MFDVRSGSAVWNFGHFEGSVNIEVDSFDQVIVSDYGDCKLHFFDSKFDQFHDIETINEDNRRWRPSGVCIDEMNSRLFVCDVDSHCLRVAKVARKK